MEVKESLVYRICMINNGEIKITGNNYEQKEEAIRHCKIMNVGDTGGWFYYYELVKMVSTYTETVISRSDSLHRIKQISGLIEILSWENLQVLLDSNFRYKTDNYEIFKDSVDYVLMAGESLDMVFEVVEEDFTKFVSEVKKVIYEEEINNEML